MKDGFEGFCRDCRDYNAGLCPTWGRVIPDGVCGIPSWRRGNRSVAEEAARYSKGQAEAVKAAWDGNLPPASEMTLFAPQPQEAPDA